MKRIFSCASFSNLFFLSSVLHALLAPWPRRELVSQLVYREAGQIFQREGAAGEPPPLRRVIGSPSHAVTQEDVKARESRKKLIRKVKLHFLLPFLSWRDELALFTASVQCKTYFLFLFTPRKVRAQPL